MGDYTFCFEFIEPEEFNNLLIFYRRLENISEYSCHDIVSKDNIGNEIERIEENIKLGKQIIEYLNK